MVRKKLEFIKTYDTEIGEGSVKAKSVLLILDRGFDTISPLVHELSYQAMIHDVIPIVNNIYTYEGKEGRQLKSEKKKSKQKLNLRLSYKNT